VTVKLKDPSDDVVYAFDWTKWLAGVDEIASATVTAGDGLTVGDVDNTTTEVTVRISGGTAGTTYSVTCAVETTGNNSAERTRQIKVVER
jgi:hypothetical protein